MNMMISVMNERMYNKLAAKTSS